MTSFFTSNLFRVSIIAFALLVAGSIIETPNTAHANGGYYTCGYFGGINISSSPVVWGDELAPSIADPRCALSVAYPYTGDYPGPGTYSPEVTTVNCVWLGPIIGGYVCDILTQFPDACAPGQGQGCAGSANVCGQSSFGVVQCDGSCNAGAPPAPVDQCTGPSDPGIQCSLAMCTCSPLNGTACSKSNACSTTSGTYDCSGTCSAAAPAPLPGNYGNGCSPTNACGFSNNGTIGCDNVTCSVSAPALPSNYGNSCQSVANACGVKGNGSIGCDNVTCSASVPALSPAVNITAAPPRVPGGAGTTLTISGSDLAGSAGNCVLTGTDGTNQAFSTGSCTPSKIIVIPAISSHTTYTVTCGPATAKVIVNVNPKFVPF
jgi:hypothetical protein